MKKTKIIASIGPASVNPDIMEKMVYAGMNVARVNFSHATIEERNDVVFSVKEVTKRTGKFIGLLWDTKGPEFRSGLMENGALRLEDDKIIRIVKGDVIGNSERFTVSYPKALDNLSVGDIVLLENGLMKLQVLSVEQGTADNSGVTCKIINGGILGDKKSMNVPGVKLNLPFISDADREDLLYACQNGGEFVAASFVSSKDDVLELREFLKEQNREDLQIISKIESVSGVENIEEIISVSDGIMVARGDLGVEVPIQDLPMIQKHLIKLCRAAGKIVIVATEMLESMKKNPRPTRAEVSDVSNAVFNGADAVMLSGETTVGKFPVEVIQYMSAICTSSELNFDNSVLPELNHTLDTPDVIAKGVIDAAEMLNVKGIVATTRSGFTARTISNLKPNSIIVAACPSDSVARGLSLNWGVYPIIVPRYDDLDDLIEKIKQEATEYLGLIKKDIVIITGGFPAVVDVKTNFMKIEEI